MAKRKSLKDAIQAEADKGLQVTPEQLEAERKWRQSAADAARYKAELEALHRELDLAHKRQAFLDGLDRDPSSRRIAFTPHKPSGQATAVIVLTDWHYEETVDPETCSGLNEYSTEIAEQRIQSVLNNSLTLLKSARTISNIRDLVVALLGDFITGYIHQELVESNQLSPVQAAAKLHDKLHECLRFYLDHADVDSVTVPTCFGNHGRTTDKSRVATAADNSYEWLLYDRLARDFRDEPRIKFKISRGYHNMLDVQGKAIRFHHGDGLRYQGGVGGITIPVVKAVSSWNQAQRADLDVFGHWHQFLSHRQFVACNCLIGYGPYAQRIKAQFSPPSQTFIVIDRKRPYPVDVREIYCD